MAEDELQQDELFAQYWNALADNPAASPPPSLNPTLSSHVRQMQPPDPSAEFVAHLEQRLRALPIPAAADNEAAPLLRGGLPVRPVRRPARRIAPFFSVAVALLVLLVGGALLAGMLAGRSQQIAGKAGLVNSNPASLTAADGQSQGDTSVLTNADQIADKASHAWDGANLQSFTAHVVMTASEAPYSIVRHSKVLYQPPDLWHADNDDIITTNGQPGQLEDTSSYIVNGQNTWDSRTTKLITYPPNAYEEMRFSDVLVRRCEGEYWLRTLLGSDVIAGRAAYVVTLQYFPCTVLLVGTPLPTFTPAPRSYTKYWLDKQTYLVLKKVYHSGMSSTDELQLEVTDIQFNPTVSAGLFAILTATQPPPLTLAQVRQQVKFPIFVPTNLALSLTPAPPVVESGSRIHLFYYTRDGRLALDVTEYPSTATSLSLLATPTANSDGVTTLPFGSVSYFYLTPYINCGYNNGTDNGIYGSYPDGRLSLVWIQNGTRISVGGPAVGSGDIQLSKGQLVQIAASMSSTADLGATQMPPTSVLPSPQPTANNCPANLPIPQSTGLPASQPTGEPHFSPPVATYGPQP